MPAVADRPPLPRVYDHREVLARWFADDEDAFYAAWASGALPLQVRKECELSLPPRAVELGLLRILIQQQTQLLLLQQALLDEIRRAPTVDQV